MNSADDKPRKALGKGLSALLPLAVVGNPAQPLLRLPPHPRPLRQSPARCRWG